MPIFDGLDRRGLGRRLPSSAAIRGLPIRRGSVSVKNLAADTQVLAAISKGLCWLNKASKLLLYSGSDRGHILPFTINL
jgi:hypothetical protein